MLSSTPILAVPLFILGGVIMAEGGISRRLFNFFSYFVGNIPGGVPCAAILTCLFYGAISGSGPATTAARRLHVHPPSWWKWAMRSAGAPA